VFDQARAPFFNAIQAANLPAIDLTKEFGPDAEALTYYGSDGHFSPKGAAFLASLIIDYADDRFDDPVEPELAGADPGDES
jgi:hypothetical protein